ncbi:unnamed protein product [Ambrosiozyma monospora]|uniref:Unnamed protein product n=1 Tax=Ambrosiozyma monospora TaxID=43982 RepID=A0A9W6WGF9_AMBMO|nr:unnamed protein product [Ambrosiozyma monospora]
MKFSHLLFSLSLAGSTLAAESNGPIIPVSATGNPTPAYNIELLTFGNDKMLAKRGFTEGYCGTSTSVYDVPTSSVWIFSWTTDGQVITATYTDYYSVPTTVYNPWCVDGAPPTYEKRDLSSDPEVICQIIIDTHEVYTTSTAMCTYQSDLQDVTSPCLTTSTGMTTETEMVCAGGDPPVTAFPHEKREPDEENYCRTYTVATDVDGVPTTTVTSQCYDAPFFPCIASIFTSEVIETYVGVSTTESDALR